MKRYKSRTKEAWNHWKQRNTYLRYLCAYNRRQIIRGSQKHFGSCWLCRFRTHSEVCQWVSHKQNLHNGWPENCWWDPHSRNQYALFWESKRVLNEIQFAYKRRNQYHHRKWNDWALLQSAKMTKTSDTRRISWYSKPFAWIHHLEWKRPTFQRCPSEITRIIWCEVI